MRYEIEQSGLSELSSRTSRSVRPSSAKSPGIRCIARLALALAGVASIEVGACGCARRETSAENENSSQGFARGDRVVVEVRSAEFFEARVVSSAKNLLRVEPQDRSAPLAVAVADAYRLNALPTAFRAGQLAICRSEERWVGCRIETAEGADLRSVTLDGKRLELAANAVLAVSAVTELNLKQAFARARAREEFREAAERAGSPQSPPGTRLLPRARVVARRGTAWYGGLVQELEDDGAQIEFSADSQRERRKSEDIVPEPPHFATPSRGDFALARPNSPSDPWQAVRVVGTSERQFRVISIDGAERLVSARDLLPLTRP